MVASHAMVRTCNRIFYIADHGVNPCELFFGDAFRAATSNNALMLAWHNSYCRKACETIRNYRAAWSYMALCPAGYFLGLKAFHNSKRF